MLALGLSDAVKTIDKPMRADYDARMKRWTAKDDENERKRLGLSPAQYAMWNQLETKEMPYGKWEKAHPAQHWWTDDTDAYDTAMVKLARQRVPDAAAPVTVVAKVTQPSHEPVLTPDFWKMVNGAYVGGAAAEQPAVPAHATAPITVVAKVADQVMVDQCDADTLARWANILGKPQEAAVAASGPVICTGTETTVIPAGTVLVRSDSMQYVTSADATITGGTAMPTVVASVAAVAGDCAAGMTLTFASPIAGINAAAMVGAVGIGGGADVEGIDAWRARVLARLQSPPRAGTSSDYVEWALSVPGITRAWCFPMELGPGTVTVRVMTDNAPDGPFADATAVAAVLAYLQNVCPVDATPYVFTPLASPLNPAIHLIPDSTANRVGVTASLNELLTREAVPGCTIPLSHFEEAIGNTVGITDFVLTSPTAAVVEPTGSRAKDVGEVLIFSWDVQAEPAGLF